MYQTLQIASVLLDDFSKLLDYSIPAEMQNEIRSGMRVEVPLRSLRRKGFVLFLKTTSPFKKLKSIHSLDKTLFLPEDLLELASWIERYHGCEPHHIFKSMIPSGIRKKVQPKTQALFLLGKTKKEILATLSGHPKSQAEILRYLISKTKPVFASEIIKELGISQSPIRSLLKKKYLKKRLVPLLSFTKENYFPTKPKKLNEEQKTCFHRISAGMENGRFETHLVHGITGSGKTEIYLHLIQKALDLKKNIIVLVPEIALTVQMIERFHSRLTVPIAVLHHKKSKGERYQAWQEILQGKIPLVLGARSSIFSPMKNLGLIIVDEEHDSSYKQTDEAPTYHARNIAVLRGKLAGATVVLGSATPSFESFYNAKINKYTLSTLNHRPTSTNLAKVKIIDMKKEYEKAGGYTPFSEALIEGIKTRYENGEQTLIFINRRGYHSCRVCTHCSSVDKCTHCDLALTFHKKEKLLRCHLCDQIFPLQQPCKECKTEHFMKFQGIGTELIEKSLHALFPNIRTLRMDRDTTRKKESHEKLFHQFRSGKADLLIGTQMIAKGFHFDTVTLVGILNTDGALSIPDFRAAERTFQLITQVAGRAGRADLPGEVILQTLIPDNRTIQSAAEQNWEQFYRDEIHERKIFGYPPFSRLVKLLFIGDTQKLAKEIAESVRQKLLKKLPSSCNLFPVQECGHAKINNRYRYQCLIRAEKILPLIPLLKDLQKICSNKVQMLIDVDPQSTFF